MHVKGKNLNDLHITTFITNKEIAKSRLHHHKFLFMLFASFFFLVTSFKKIDHLVVTTALLIPLSSSLFK